jgi:hypothetical protein
MTLYLELCDSSTNSILGRLMDARGSNDSFARRSSSVSNMAAADSIMRSWAQVLREQLESSRARAALSSGLRHDRGRTCGPMQIDPRCVWRLH